MGSQDKGLVIKGLAALVFTGFLPERYKKEQTVLPHILFMAERLFTGLNLLPKYYRTSRNQMVCFS